MSSHFDNAAQERAAYVHIPFCHRRCPYCDFAVVDMEREPAPVDRYVAAVVSEIQMEPLWEPLHAVNLGGGTPSILDATHIESILGSLQERFGITSGAEISIEANPEDITAGYSEELINVGINRVSLGVQSFDEQVLTMLGRNHTPLQAANAVRNLERAGMRSINLDLIFGTPGESIASWRSTASQAFELGTAHISAYSLTVERGTELSRAVAAGAAVPDDDDQADKYELLSGLLASSMSRYEISNWAVPGFECRYNLTTWAQGEYIAFGMGAHGHRSGVRRRNHRRLDVYLDDIEAGTRPELGAEQADEWAREKERVFLGIRRTSGVLMGRAGVALLDTDVGGRFVAAGVVATVAGRLVVQNPLLTDAVAREVLALSEPAG